MLGYRHQFRRFKVRYWRYLLLRTRGNVCEAARLAHCNRTQAYKLFAQLKIEPAKFRQRPRSRSTRELDVLTKWLRQRRFTP